jgi:repressor LexA
MPSLTKRQKQILDFIIKSVNLHGFPPSTSEIQEEFSFKSPNSVQDHLLALGRKRYIARHPHKSRGIEVLVYRNNKQENRDSNAVEVPIVGRVAAGMPVLAQENIEGELMIDKSLTKSSGDDFVLKIKGDSMIEAGILDGDYVLVHQQQSAEEGDIIVALIEDEATVKKFYKDKSLNRVILRPANESMKPIYVDLSCNNFMILGKVTGVIRKI